MKVRDAMTRDVQLARLDDTIGQVAKVLARHDIGFMPVADDERLLGMITDRDIAVRAVAHGKSADTPVRDVMTADIRYCFDDQELEEVARNMAEIQVRRMPVVDRDKRLVGILSLADAARADGGVAAAALEGVVRPGGQHTQSVA